MICAVKKEFRPAGNGTEFPDHQLFFVDWIMVQHILLLKFPGIMDKIVVHGKLPHLDSRIRHHIFQVNRFPVALPRIYLFRIHALSPLRKFISGNRLELVVFHAVNGMFRGGIDKGNTGRPDALLADSTEYRKPVKYGKHLPISL